MSLGRPRKAKRNREILLAVVKGVSPEEVAALHNLTLQRVQAIVVAERNKIAFSPDPTYRAMRSQPASPQTHLFDDTTNSSP
jgi:hypothetical protein